jgi:murein DD-endopeptidase MepM/ murein hydrolase activator NlpD
VPRGVRAGLAALVLVAGVPAAAAASGPTTTDPATRKTQVDRERRQLAERYDETLAVEADLTAAYEQSRARAAELTQKLATLDDYVVAVQKELDAATATAGQAVQRRDAFREDLKSATAELARRRDDLRATAVSGYVWFGERGTVHGAYGQGVMADEALVSSFYAGYLNQVQDQRVRRVEQQEARVEQLTDDARAASDRAEAARKEVAQRRADLQTARDESAAAKAAADAEAEHQHQLVAQVEAKRVDYEAQLASLQRESAQIGALLRAREAAAPGAAAPPAARPAAARTPRPPAAPATTAKAKPAPAPKPPPAPRPSTAPTASTPAGGVAPPTTNNAGSGPPPAIAVQLSYPLPGYPVVSTYGWRVHPILGVRKLHEGIDIWAPEGTPIHAAAAGTVVWAGPRNGYGNAVIIDHGSGVATAYAHQSAVAVSAGQSVGRGDVIGYVGHTGLAAGPHLHFEVRVGGKTYDPLAYVHPG